MNRIISYSLSTLFLIGIWACLNPVTGQVIKDTPGLAGPDKRTCISSQNGYQTLPVTIGPEHKVSGWCYRWDPPLGLSDPYIANPEATPETTQVYTLTITGDDFAYEITDQMTVEVDAINDFSVTPKLCCFKGGTKFTVEMFNITTDPPGMERQITFDPPNAPYPLPGLQTQTKTVVVSTKCAEWGPSLNESVQILVVNEDIFTTSQVTVGDIEKALEKVEAAIKLISEKANIPGSPCEVSKPALTKVFAVSTGTLCCPTKGCAIEQRKVSGTAKFCAGFECDWPIPSLTIPLVASVNLAASFKTCLGIGVEYKDKCDGGDVCLKGVSEVKIGLGISAIILHKDVQKWELKGEYTIFTPTFEICVPSLDFKFIGPLCYSADLVGSVTTFKFWKEEVKFNVISKTCFGGTGVIY
jgi:hypothetical protein